MRISAAEAAFLSCWAELKKKRKASTDMLEEAPQIWWSKYWALCLASRHCAMSALCSLRMLHPAAPFDGPPLYCRLRPSLKKSRSVGFCLQPTKKRFRAPKKSNLHQHQPRSPPQLSRASTGSSSLQKRTRSRTRSYSSQPQQGPQKIALCRRVCAYRELIGMSWSCFILHMHATMGMRVWALHYFNFEALCAQTLVGWHKFV